MRAAALAAAGAQSSETRTRHPPHAAIQALELLADRVSGDRYRLRVGDYRVIYEIVDEQLIILIVGVGHRREAYRPLS